MGDIFQPGPVALSVQQARGWDNQLRALMLAGKQLPILPESLRTTQYEVQGCESQVWLQMTTAQQQITLRAFSPSKIVRGLLALICEALAGKTPEQIKAFDLQRYLAEINLERHLSQSRNNGLHQVMQAILNQI
ncbi:SufE family protein [Lacimicrobium alkaliphilum]|uniref:Cysteine desulfurase, sulfur acceptor subunit CsdE n=1 Tax=Lacimicrobium alkaliphilum TaxID=1526571 RepID=A0ABQ1R3A2_9ALTE|nr:SufE family protein [Lacimicrobium alkaliphilum]GGD54766.1 cysteine desulfurase, sulfur acceptor subunit CsdE [Lacimicrobium alkaliphilum]